MSCRLGQVGADRRVAPEGLEVSTGYSLALSLEALSNFSAPGGAASPLGLYVPPDPIPSVPGSGLRCLSRQPSQASLSKVVSVHWAALLAYVGVGNLVSSHPFECRGPSDGDGAPSFNNTYALEADGRLYILSI